MFIPSSRNASSSRTLFAATGVVRAMPMYGITPFRAGQTLLGASVLTIDPSGGSGE